MVLRAHPDPSQKPSDGPDAGRFLSSFFFLPAFTVTGMYPPPPCTSTALSKHGVGVEPLFLGIFGTTVFVVPYVTWGLKTVYHTLPPDDVCFDVILSHSCYSPSTAYHHLHLRDLLDVGGHVCLPSCVPHAGTVLSKHGVGVEPLFLGIFGTTVFVVPYVTWGLKTVYHTLPPDDVCFDVILSHSCYSPSTAYHHLHLRDLLDVGDHVCLQARSCLSTGWALNRCF